MGLICLSLNPSCMCPWPAGLWPPAGGPSPHPEEQRRKAGFRLFNYIYMSDSRVSYGFKLVIYEALAKLYTNSLLGLSTESIRSFLISHAVFLPNASRVQHKPFV